MADNYNFYDGSKNTQSYQDPSVSQGNSLFNQTSLPGFRTEIVPKDDYAAKMGTKYFDASHRGFNYERYYNHPNFYKLGFSPYRDNESVYNANSSWFDEMQRAAPQMWELTKLGFTSGLKSFGRMLEGDFSPDLEEAEEYEKAANIGMSSKGGIGGFTTNLFLNSGYTMGIIGEVLAEELVLVGLTAMTEGVAGELLAARTAQNVQRVGKGINNISDFQKKVKMTNRLKDLKDMQKAKGFYQKAGKALNAINPLTGTTNVISNWNKMDNLSNLGKVSKGFGNFYRDIRDLNMVYAESQLEAGMMYNKVYDDLYTDAMRNGQTPSEQDTERMRSAALAAQDMSLYSNLGLIYLTNKVSFAPIMKRFKRVPTEELAQGKNFKTIFNKEALKDPAKKLLSVVDKEKANLFKWSTLRRQPIRALKGAFAYSKTNFSEGVQEYFQESIASGFEKYGKDKYAGREEGGYWDYYANGIKSMANGQGFETFMSGFLMGAPIKGAQQVGIGVYDRIDKKRRPDKYKKETELDQLRRQRAEEDAEIINEWVKNNPQEGYFSNALNSFRELNILQQEMNEAEIEGDTKRYMDAKHEKKIKALQNVIRSPELLKQFKSTNQELLNLSDEELVEAFSDGNTTASDIRKSLTDDINHVDKLHRLRKDLSKANPFNPISSATKEPTPEELTDHFSYMAWEEGIDDRVMLVDQFDNTQERVVSLTDEILKNDMFSKFKSRTMGGKTRVTPQDVQATLSVETMQDELRLLDSQIKALEAAETLSTEDRQELNKLKSISKSLTKLRDSVKDSVLESNITEETILEELNQLASTMTLIDQIEKGEEEIPDSLLGETDEETQQNIDQLKELAQERIDDHYENYLDEEGEIKKDLEAAVGAKSLKSVYNSLKAHYKNLAKQRGEIYNDTNFDNIFEKYKDIYALEKDGENLAKQINMFADPKNFAKYHENKVKEYKRHWANRKEEIATALKKHYESEELNRIANDLQDKFEAFLLPEDMAKLFNTELNQEERLPQDILDTNTLEPILAQDRRNSILDYLRDAIGIKDIVEEEKEAVEEVDPTQAVDVENTPAIAGFISEEFPKTPAGLELAEDFMSDLQESYNNLSEEKQDEFGDIDSYFEANPKAVQQLKRRYKKEASDSTPKQEIKEVKKTTPKKKSSKNIETQKADIERRRQEELNDLNLKYEERDSLIDLGKKPIQGINITKTHDSLDSIIDDLINQDKIRGEDDNKIYGKAYSIEKIAQKALVNLGLGSLTKSITGIEAVDLSNFTKDKAKAHYLNILNTLKPYVEDVNIRSYKDNVKDIMQSKGVAFATTGDVLLGSTAGHSLQVLTHELVHTFTIKALDPKSKLYNKEFSDEISRLYNIAKENIKGEYGLKNKEELLAEAFAKPSFMNKLAQIKTNPNNKESNLFKDIINTVSNLFKSAFGLDVKSTLLADIQHAIGLHLEKEGSVYNTKERKNKIKEINDKYDAELTALEKTTPSKTKTSNAQQETLDNITKLQKDNAKFTETKITSNQEKIDISRPTVYINNSKEKTSSLETLRSGAKREWGDTTVITGERMQNFYVGLSLFAEVFPEHKELLNRFIKNDEGRVGINNNKLSYVINTLKKEGINNQKDLGNKIDAKYDELLDQEESVYTDGNLIIERQSNFKARVRGKDKPDAEAEARMLQGAARGNLADITGRAIFDGASEKDVKGRIEEFITEANDMNSKSKNPYSVNMNQKEFDQMVDDLIELKNNLEKKGYKFVANDVFVYMEYTQAEKEATGKDGVGGTLDLVAVAPDGKIAIIDFKTVKATGQQKAATRIFVGGTNAKGETYEDSISSWADQQTIYSDMMMSSHGIESESINIFALISNYKTEDNLVQVTSNEAFTSIPPQSSVEGVPSLIKLERTDISNDLEQVTKGYTAPAEVEDISELLPEPGDILEQQGLEEIQVKLTKPEISGLTVEPTFIVRKSGNKLKNISTLQTKYFVQDGKIYRLKDLGNINIDRASELSGTNVTPDNVISNKEGVVGSWLEAKGDLQVYTVEEMEFTPDEDIMAQVAKDHNFVEGKKNYLTNSVMGIVDKIPGIDTATESQAKSKIYTALTQRINDVDTKKLEEALGGPVEFANFMTKIQDTIYNTYVSNIPTETTVENVKEGTVVKKDGKSAKVLKKDKTNTVVKTQDGNIEKVDNDTLVAVEKPTEKQKISKEDKSTMKTNYDSSLSIEQRQKASEAASKLSPAESKKNMFDAINNNCK